MCATSYKVEGTLHETQKLSRDSNRRKLPYTCYKRTYTCTYTCAGNKNWFIILSVSTVGGRNEDMAWATRDVNIFASHPVSRITTNCIRSNYGEKQLEIDVSICNIFTSLVGGPITICL